jgi:hypothetical protein
MLCLSMLISTIGVQQLSFGRAVLRCALSEVLNTDHLMGEAMKALPFTPWHAPSADMYRSVLTAAQLLSEGVSGQQGSGFAAGFDWAAEQLRQAGYEQLAAEVSSYSNRACPYKSTGSALGVLPCQPVLLLDPQQLAQNAPQAEER